jgi:pimeloyl-ACP methyl ester carboxylesterase
VLETRSLVLTSRERIRDRPPARPVLALEGVGHWPALEAPDLVANELLGALRVELKEGRTAVDVSVSV